MKKIITVLFLFLNVSISVGQTKLCDCSGPLSRDLTSKFSSTEYRRLKEWLYEYFKSDAVTQTKMKKDKSITWSTGATAFIEAVPVKGNFDGTNTNSQEDQTYNRLIQTFMRESFLSNEQFNQVVAEQMGDNQLTAYLACLEVCKRDNSVPISKAGISFIQGGNLNDEISIQINYKSFPLGITITLADDAQISNLEPSDKLIFKKGFKIKDGQSITQFFRRLDPSKSARILFSIVENVSIEPIILPPAPNAQQVPIGTIVVSVLNYNAFLEANGFQQTEDTGRAIWVPCDGRFVSGSRYSSFGGPTPDLRGLFLRGINDYGAPSTGVRTVAEDHKNPENTPAGIFQNDNFKKHTHPVKNIGLKNDNLSNSRKSGAPDGREFTQSQDVPKDHPLKDVTELFSIEPAGEGVETRPRNMTVYYHIKIN